MIVAARLACSMAVAVCRAGATCGPTPLSLARARILTANGHLHNLQIRSLANITKPAEKNKATIEDLLEKQMAGLSTDIHQKNRVYKSDLLRILGNVKDKNFSTKSQGLLLLRCCSDLLPDESASSRMTLVDQVWNTLKPHTTFGIEHYNELIRCYIANNHPLNASSFVSQMSPVKPNVITYELILQAICEAGDLNQAAEVISNMKALGISATAKIFNSLIIGHGRAGNLQNIEEVLTTMNTLKVEVSMDTYTAIARAYALNNNAAGVVKYLDIAKKSGFQLQESHIMEIYKCAAVQGLDQVLPKVLEYLPEATLRSPSISPYMQSITTELVYLNCPLAALEVYKCLPLPSFGPKDDRAIHGRSLVRDCVKASMPSSVVGAVARELASSGRNPIPLENACEAALQLARTPLALDLLVRMISIKRLQPSSVVGAVARELASSGRNPIALENACEAALQLARTPLALDLLVRMISIKRLQPSSVVGAVARELASSGRNPIALENACEAALQLARTPLALDLLVRMISIKRLQPSSVVGAVARELASSGRNPIALENACEATLQLARTPLALDLLVRMISIKRLQPSSVVGAVARELASSGRNPIALENACEAALQLARTPLALDLLVRMISIKRLQPSSVVGAVARELASSGRNPIALENACEAALQLARTPLALDLLVRMISIKRLQPSSVVGAVARELASSGRNPIALENACEAALQLARTPLALDLLVRMRAGGLPLRPHYFWPILLTNSKGYGEKGVMNTITTMVSMEVTPDYDTMLDYVLPYVSFSSPQNLMKKLLECGMSVSGVLTPMMHVLVSTGQLRAASELCELFEGGIDSEKLLSPLIKGYLTCLDVQSTVYVLEELSKRATQKSNDWIGRFLCKLLTHKKIKEDRTHFVELLKGLKSRKLKISTSATELCMSYVSARGGEEETRQLQAHLEPITDEGLVDETELFLTQIPHPRSMNESGLRSHLSELEAKSMNTRGVLRKLLQMYCREGNLKAAQEIVEKCEKEDVFLSAGMKASIFDLYVKLGELEFAEQSLAELNKSSPNFTLDEFKVIDLATLMVCRNQIKKAFDLITQQTQRRRVVGGRSIETNCWRLLDAMASTGTAKQTQEMLNLLLQHRYCRPSNVILGPLIRVHIKNADIPQAVNEFVRISNQYKRTPLKHELLCRVLADMADGRGEEGFLASERDDARRGRLVQAVLQADRKVHGRGDVQLTLLGALAELGYKRSLRKLLLDPKVHVHQEALLRRCERFADEKKLAPVETIAECARDLRHIDTDPLYEIMLQVYQRTDDCAGALSLWHRMQEEDVRPSEKFAHALVSLLRANNRPAPPELLALLDRRTRSEQLEE